MAPAYIAVAARHTLQRPTPAPETVNLQKVTWSPAVRQYVRRAFEAENAIVGIDQTAMQEKLKVVITRAAQVGNLEAIDWTTYTLPQHLILAERERDAAMGGGLNATLTNVNAPASSSSSTDGALLPHGSLKKRKSGNVELLDGANDDGTPPWKKSNTKGGLEDRITGKTKAQSKKDKKGEAFRAHDVGADSETLEKRRQRFGYVTPDPSPFLSSRDDSPNPPTAGPLVGTCQDLEKSYFRLTAPPHPGTVRPLPVLERALSHIRSKWRKDHNYSYACDQLKSLRQDLTVQHLQNALTVQTYEVHARIALEMKDLGEYNQCQTQLRPLYRMGLSGNPDEFLAYRILYIIYTCNRTDMNNVLADLTPADKQKKEVRHALQVRSALASGNYHRFFRLYFDAPSLGYYLLDLSIERERLAAMATICKGYKPDLSLHFLTTELAFDGQAEQEDGDTAEPDAGLRHCLEFLCRHGGEAFVLRREDGDVRFAVGKASAVFEAAKAKAFRGVDIKGQI